MRFKMSNGGVFELSQHAIERMTPFTQATKDSFEGGGILLGRFIIDSKNIILDEVSIPMIGDKRSRFGFFRSERAHQKFAESKWANSKETCNYLGEWHTHPENYPSPSSIDMKNWKNKLQEGQFTSRYLYFIIVGIKDIRLWEGDRRTLSIKKLIKYEN